MYESTPLIEKAEDMKKGIFSLEVFFGGVFKYPNPVESPLHYHVGSNSLLALQRAKRPFV